MSKFIQRRQEFGRFGRLLSAPKSSILIVRGMPGTGKSVLLSSFAEIAQSKGYPILMWKLPPEQHGLIDLVVVLEQSLQEISKYRNIVSKEEKLEPARQILDRIRALTGFREDDDQRGLILQLLKGFSWSFHPEELSYHLERVLSYFGERAESDKPIVLLIDSQRSSLSQLEVVLDMLLKTKLRDVKVVVATRSNGWHGKLNILPALKGRFPEINELTLPRRLSKTDVTRIVKALIDKDQRSCKLVDKIMSLTDCSPSQVFFLLQIWPMVATASERAHHARRDLPTMATEFHRSLPLAVARLAEQLVYLEDSVPAPVALNILGDSPETLNSFLSSHPSLVDLVYEERSNSRTVCRNPFYRDHIRSFVQKRGYLEVKKSEHRAGQIYLSLLDNESLYDLCLAAIFGPRHFEWTGDWSAFVYFTLRTFPIKLVTGSFESAQRELLVSQAYLETMGNKSYTEFQAACSTALGLLNEERGRHSESLALFDQALIQSRFSGNRARVAHNLARIAHRLAAEQDYPTAIVYLSKTLELFEQVGDETNWVAIKCNLGMLYQKMNKMKEAQICYEEALRIDLRTSNHSGAALSYRNLGFIYKNNGDLTTALAYHRKALEQSRLGQNLRDIAIDKANIGATLLNLNQKEEAILYLKEAAGSLSTLGAKEEAKVAIQLLDTAQSSAQQGTSQTD